MENIRKQVFQQVLRAKGKVYELFGPTPLQKVDRHTPAKVWVKREDLSPIHSYKWRGAFNCISGMKGSKLARGVVAASSGNHAQGVAASAAHLGVKATLFMPETTPHTKRCAVSRFGASHVEVVVEGKDYHETAEAAWEYAHRKTRGFVHPYDDAAVMGGQGTIADEVVNHTPGVRFDAAFLQVGGGGLAAGMALWLKSCLPDLKVVGVEAQGQASMNVAFKAGRPVDLSYVDSFCDGTSVKRVGDLNYALCRELLDDLITVSNEEVAAAMKMLWDAGRFIPEPSGALGVAGFLQCSDSLEGKEVLTIISGANMNFEEISSVLENAIAATRVRQRFIRNLSEASSCSSIA